MYILYIILQCIFYIYKITLNSKQGKTLEDISSLVQKLTKRINENKAALAPVVTELRAVRVKYQVGIT